ncbi:MAG: hypothetical protein WAK12_11295 [Acidimicrobiales bacterium]
MFDRSRRLVLVSRVGLAGAIMLTTLALSLGTDVTSSSAASNSAFCKTIFTWAAISEKNEAPKTVSADGFHAWAKLLLPFYVKLAAESSGKTQVVFKDLVKIFTYYQKGKSISAIVAFETLNHKTFLSDTKAVAASIEACE